MAMAACQFEPVIGDRRANLDRVGELAASLPADVALAVFPELCLTGYDLNDIEGMAEPVPGPTSDEAVTLSRNVKTKLVLGLPERDGSELYNTTIVVSPEGVQATYRKQYLWGEEDEVFRPGDQPTVIETQAGRVGILCCYDLNFPEVALAYAHRDCDVLVVPAAWRESFYGDWRLLCRARARDGPCYVIGSNHTGDQRGREHAGHSLIAGPSGEILAEADETSGTVIGEISNEVLCREHEQNPVRETRRAREQTKYDDLDLSESA